MFRNSPNQGRYRAIFHDPDSRDGQGRLIGTGCMRFEQNDRRTVIVLYFPPEDYPPVNGIYPIVNVYVNDLSIADIQLDGTHQIHKPLQEIYWYPGCLMSLFSLTVHSNHKPFYSLELVDSISMNHLWNTTAFWFLSPRRIFKLISDDFAGSIPNERVRGVFLSGKVHQLQNKYGNITNDSRPYDHYAITYPYERASNVIKRFLRQHIEKKRQKIRDRIGLVIKALPGGIEFEQLASNYGHWGH